MINLQIQRANGEWRDLTECEGVDFISRCVDFSNNEKTKDQVVAILESGKSVKWDSDWNGELRKKRSVAPRVAVIDSHIDSLEDY